jgi:hypothetical protein
MKTLPLTKGHTVIVDDDDFEELNKWKWSALVSSQTGKVYAVRGVSIGGGKTKTLLMHKFLLSSGEVDHIDGNGLNNQRHNLRYCTRLQNAQNQKLRKTSRSGFKGVSLRHNGEWGARITVNKEPKWIGYFKTPIEAAKAYNAAAVKYFGEFARLNHL